MSVRAAQSLAAWKTWEHTHALLHFDPHPRLYSGPLAEVAVSVKDILPVAGMPTRGGSLALSSDPANFDTDVVSDLRRAGAAVVAKSNCGEFGMGVTVSETRLGGRVIHPFNQRLSPGGSSGGDAVAVATGVVDLGVATDYGGSVRWPAQSVGVVGLRTTAGLLGRTGRTPPYTPGSLQAELETIGLFARDAGLLLRVLPHVGVESASETDVTRFGRVAVTVAPEVGIVSDEVASAFGRLATVLGDTGFKVVEAGPVFAGAAGWYAFLRQALDDLASLRYLVSGREDLLCPATREAIEEASSRPVWDPGQIAAARRAATATRSRLSSLLERVDGVVLPVAPVPATDASGAGYVGGPYAASDLMAFCRAVSLTGFPSLSIPIASCGRPVSVQVVTAPGTDFGCVLLGQLIRGAAEVSDG